MNRKPEVCVLPVAGLSTRNLPTTKVLHKGFMTLDNIPVIQYAVNSCALWRRRAFWARARRTRPTAWAIRSWS